MSDVLLAILIVMPFVTTASTIYLWNLYLNARYSRLALTLAGTATVTLISASWLGALIINTRVLGRTNDPAFTPITLVAIIAPLAAINATAFVLWRGR